MIGRRPATVLAWGAARMTFQAVVLAVYAPLMLALFGRFASIAASGGSRAPDVAAIAPQAAALQGVGFLLQIAGLLVVAVLYCGVFRAILHPDQSRYAYLRLGGAEFFTAVLLFAFGIAVVVGVLVAMIPIGIVAGLFAAFHAVGPAITVAVLGAVAFVAVLIYLGARLAFVGPMLVEDNELHLGEAWALSRGRAGSLVLIGLWLFGIFIVGEIVIGALMLGATAGLAFALAGGPDALVSLLQQNPLIALQRLAPIALLWLVVGVPLTGIAQAVLLAPWAKAYRDVGPSAAAPAAFT